MIYTCTLSKHVNFSFKLTISKFSLYKFNCFLVDEIGILVNFSLNQIQTVENDEYECVCSEQAICAQCVLSSYF